jgi:hypothetical protein
VKASHVDGVEITKLRSLQQQANKPRRLAVRRHEMAIRLESGFLEGLVDALGLEPRTR